MSIQRVLIRRAGSFDLAEESLQEAFSTAIATWERDGTPQNPGAWLTTVAHRKLVDTLRREKTKSDKQPALEYETQRLKDDDWPAPLEEEPEYTDDRFTLKRQVPLKLIGDKLWRSTLSSSGSIHHP